MRLLADFTQGELSSGAYVDVKDLISSIVGKAVMWGSVDSVEIRHGTPEGQPQPTYYAYVTVSHPTSDSWVESEWDILLPDWYVAALDPRN